jgi:hypothetical protein
MTSGAAQQSQREYIRPEVMAFAHAMETTLRKNDHKGGWSECGLGYLLDGVEREYTEAREAWDAVKNQKDYYRVSEELVDVANFCMMFWESMELTKVNNLLALYSRPHAQVPDIIPMTQISLQAFKDEVASAAMLEILTALATFLDNADNISDSGNANKFVSLPKLFKWMIKRGWTP